MMDVRHQLRRRFRLPPEKRDAVPVPVPLRLRLPVYECECCGGGFVWPKPAPDLLRRFYASGYWSAYLGSDEPLYCRPNWREFKRYVECIDRILKKNRTARILDVGAGDGTLLRVLADAGFSSAVGMEPSEENALRARQRLPALGGEFLDFMEKGWDAVKLWAVAEHLADRLSYLQPVWKESLLRAHRFLRATGARLDPNPRFWRRGVANSLVAWQEHRSLGHGN